MSILPHQVSVENRGWLDVPKVWMGEIIHNWGIDAGEGESMNPNTGHLIRINGELPEGYQEIPLGLETIADEQLIGRDEVYIDLDSDSPLAQWAADQRRHKEKKKRRNRRRRKEVKARRKRR